MPTVPPVEQPEYQAGSGRAGQERGVSDEEAALATDPADRAPGQEEPGSEDEADRTSYIKGGRHEGGGDWRERSACALAILFLFPYLFIRRTSCLPAAAVLEEIRASSDEEEEGQAVQEEGQA